jgi:hypothetical protein
MLRLCDALHTDFEVAFSQLAVYVIESPAYIRYQLLVR